MTGLLIKDWKVLKRQGRYFVVAILLVCAMSLAGSKNMSSFVTSYVTFMLSMFSFSSFSYDEYDNGMAFLMALPSGRQDYVKEKYLFSFLLVFGGWLAGVLLRMVFFQLRFSMEEYLETLFFDPVYLLICLSYVGLMLPSLVRYGSEKGRNIAFTGVAVFVIAFFVAGKIATPVLQRIVAPIESNPAMFLLWLAVACLLIWTASYRISSWFIQKKEF